MAYPTDSSSLLAAVALTRAVRSAIQVESVPNYHIIHEADSDAHFTLANAPDYCREQFNTSLASFHNIEQYRSVINYIESVLGSNTGLYWIGMHYESHEPQTLDCESTEIGVNNFRKADSTLVDFIVPGFAGFFSCVGCFTVWNDEWPVWTHADCYSSKIRDFACNNHLDTDWQTMNPRRTDLLSCTDEMDCTLDCTVG